MNILNRYTLNVLKKNKSRTIVTIVGIILSLAMLTATTVLIASSQSFIVNKVKEIDGDWYGVVMAADENAVKDIQNNEEVSESFLLQNVGYSVLDGGINQYKPYLFVGGADKNFFEKMYIKLTSGRLPQNSSEIILPEHLYSNGGVSHAIGDVLSIEIGERIFNADGTALMQNSPLTEEQDGGEHFEPLQKKSYTVVGFYSRGGFESYTAPGYTALTLYDESQTVTSDVYIITAIASKIYSVLDKYNVAPYNLGNMTNSDLLMFMGSGNLSTFNAVLYGLSAVLIAIIVLASISLIYNAFSISVSERTKQFGLLASVGATKKQIRSSVIFEALTLCAVGIPIGIISGIVGIAVTLNATRGLFQEGFGESGLILSNVYLKLTPAPWAIALAAVLGLITVLISAYLPSRKAAEVPIIEAVRQTSDIKINPKNMKISPLIQKLFGLEGVIAAKNFKRNKKRYNATIMSLFMSIVLFISAYSFCDYLNKSVEALISDVDYDLQYSIIHEYNDEVTDMDANLQTFSDLSKMPYVTQSSFILNHYFLLSVNKSDLSQDFLPRTEENRFGENDKASLYVQAAFVDDETYSAWLKENKYDTDVYMNAEKPVALLINNEKVYNMEDGKYYTYTPFAKTNIQCSAVNIQDFDESNYYLLKTIQTSEGEMCVFVKYDNGLDLNNLAYVSGTQWGDAVVFVPAQQAVSYNDITIAGQVSDYPFGLLELKNNPTLLYPMSAISKVVPNALKNNNCYGIMNFSSTNVKQTESKMGEYLGERRYLLYNSTQNYETNRALITIVNIFAYGFIVLISLIAAANVFNTISTSISLRRREFAVLKSIGMTDKGFKKMMNLECILYGIKSLALGLPVAIGVAYIIYIQINRGWNTAFYAPVKGIVIAILSVFIVVFSTMLYSTRKVKKENTVDALKNENL